VGSLGEGRGWATVPRLFWVLRAGKDGVYVGEVRIGSLDAYLSPTARFGLIVEVGVFMLVVECRK
jgi:hypothetical protein